MMGRLMICMTIEFAVVAGIAVPHFPGVGGETNEGKVYQMSRNFRVSCEV